MPRALVISFKCYPFDARLQRHTEALAERGYEVDVICIANSLTRNYGSINFIQLEMPYYRGSHRLRYLLSYFRFFLFAAYTAFRRSFKTLYEIVVVCSMPDAMVLSALPTKLFGSAIVLDVRDTMPELYREKFGAGEHNLGARLLMLEERVSAWLADRVLAVHDPHRERLELAGIPAEKISVVMNSPEPRIFARTRKPKPAAAQDFTLVYHGTATPRLGLDLVLQAISLLREQIAGLRFVALCVDDDDEDYVATLRSLTSRLKIEDCVTFRERVPVVELPDILAQAAVGIVPNRASSATRLMLPVKLLEYAMLGIPVIAPRLETIQRYFDEKAVRFFAPGDPEDLSAAIAELYRNPKRRVELSRRAAQVADQLSWPKQKFKYYQAIDSAIGNYFPSGSGVEFPQRGGKR